LQGPDKIVDLEILIPSSEKEYLTQKGPILDLRARDGKGQQFNVEVQLRAGVDDYKKRTLFYIAKFYCDQLQKGQGYNSLKRTISISILDFNLFPNTEELHSKFVMWDCQQEFALCDDLELHYLELKKFSPNKPEQLRTRFEKWLYLLKFADLYDTNELPIILAEEEGMTMAIDSMRKAYARDEVRELIAAQEKAERDEISRLEYARSQGLKEGLEQGLEKGREEERKRTEQERAKAARAEAELARVKEELEALRRRQE